LTEDPAKSWSIREKEGYSLSLACFDFRTCLNTEAQAMEPAEKDAQVLGEKDVMAPERGWDRQERLQPEDLEILHQNDLLNTDTDFGHISLMFGFGSDFAA